MNVFDLVATLRLDSSQYEAGLRNIGKSNTLGILNSAANKIMTVGAAAAGAAVAGLTAFAKASVQTGMQFDTAMSQVAATMGTTVDQIGELRDFAQEMGAKTAFSATQAAEALNYMALAGYDANQSMEMLPNVLNLAAAGSMDLARASDMVTDAQTALGLTADETTTMVDQMAATASKSNTSVSQLGDAMLTIGATARNLKGGTQELSTVLGVLADNGIKGAEGGTHLRNAILALQTPTKDGTAALEQLGMTYEDMYDSAGNLRSLPEIFQQMSSAMEGMTQQSKDAIISGVFNKTDLASINALLGTSVDRWTELGAAIGASAGAAEKMANTQLDNLNGDITLMKSAWEGIKIAVSDGVTPAIRVAVQNITKLISNRNVQKFFADLGKKLGELASTLTGKIANAIPRLISLFQRIEPAIVPATAAIGAFLIMVKGFTNPVGTMITILGGLAGALALDALTADDAKKKFSGLTDEQYRNVEATLDSIEAYKQIAQSREENYASIDRETQQTKDLWGELQTLVDEKGRVIAGNEAQAKSIVEQLNQMGIEIEMIDGEIQGYNELASSIADVIEQRRANMKLQAAEEGYNTAKDNLSGVQETIYDLESEVATAQGKVSGLQNDLTTLLSTDMSDATVAANVQWEMEQVREAYAQANQALAERQAELQTAKAQEAQYYEDIGNYERAFAEASAGNWDAVNEILDKNSQAHMRHLVETGNITQQEIDQLQRNADILVKTTERYAEELANGAAGHTQEGYEKLQAQTEEALQLLADAKEQITASGSESGEAYTQGLSDSASAVGSAASELADTAVKEIEGKAPSMKSASSKLGSEAVKGVSDKKGDMKSASSSVADAGVNGLRSKGGEYYNAGAYLAGQANSGYSSNLNLSPPSGGGSGHAIGLDFVPFNDYPAMLHRGEAVLTAREAEDWRRGNAGGGNGIVINQSIETVPQTPVELAAATLAMFEQARWSVA